MTSDKPAGRTGRQPVTSMIFPRETWKRNQLTVFIMAALIFGGFTIVMPFLPLYVQQLGVRGVSRTALWSGILLSVTPMLAAILAPVWGRLADRFGLKIMAQRVTLAMVVTWTLFAFATNVYHLLALRIALGLFGGFNAVSIPLLTRLSPRDKVNPSIGILQSVQIASTALGPMIGGFLADHIGIQNTCLVTAFLCALAFIFVVAFYEEDPAAGTEALPDGAPADTIATEEIGRALAQPLSLREVVHLHNFPALIIMLFLGTLVDRTLWPIIPLYLLDLGTLPQNVAKVAGLIISVGALAASISAVVAGRCSNRSSPKMLLLLTLISGAAINLPLAFINSSFQFLALRFFLGLLTGGVLTIIYSIGSLVIPYSSRASSYAVLSSASMLGGALGPITSGFLTSIGLRAVFVFNMVIYLLLIPIAVQKINLPEISVPVEPLSAKIKEPAELE